MIAASAALQTYLSTRSTFYMADLFTITPKWGLGGASLYYTTAGRTILTGLGGTPGPWLPFPIERSKIKVTRGIEVGELDLICHPRVNNRIATFEIGDPGSGYAYGDRISIVQTGAVGGELMVTTVGGSGEVLDAVLFHPGHFYQVEDGLATTMTGGGTGCTINILTLTDDFIGTVPWMTAAAVNGQLDGALITVYRAFFDAPTDASPIGTWP